jgi:glutamate racemase
MNKSSESPIGIFDSGIGGLTVLKEMIETLPDENTIYLGDTARVPYGTRSKDTIRRYAFECADFLMSCGIKLMVVACNTVSSVCLEELKKHYAVPVIGVVDPGARAAVRESRTGNVVIIGTRATIESNAYRLAIKRYDSSISVEGIACALFVPLIEEGWVDDAIAREVVYRYLSPLKVTNIDTVVLGCTHYPILKGAIHEAVGSRVSLVDSAVETASEVRESLDRNLAPKRQSKAGYCKFYVTDDPGRFACERLINGDSNCVKCQDLLCDGLPKSA